MRKFIYIILAFIVVFSALTLYKVKGKLSVDGKEIHYMMATTLVSKEGKPLASVNPKDPLLKREGHLMIESEVPNSQNMAKGVMCVQNSSQLDKVDLYMPDMGHGSQPPVVKKADVPSQYKEIGKSLPDFGCFQLESMQFFMSGHWQVRVFFKDQMMGYFDVKVEK